MRRILLCAVLLWGCDDPEFLECDGGTVVDMEGTPTCVYADAGGVDAGTDAGVDAGELPFDAGLPDAGEPLDDAPDCLDERDCIFDSNSVLDLVTAPERSIVERIDGADHDIPTACGPVRSTDRDVFRIRAPVRSIVEIVAERDSGGSLFPVLETYDTSLRYLLTFGEGEPSARTVLINPNPAPEAIHVMVQHQAAYQGLCAAGGSAVRGGPEFGYTLTARRCAGCSLENLGSLGAGLSESIELAAQGDFAAYLFTAPGSADPTVSVALSGSCPASISGGCCPIVVPLVPGGDTPAEVRAQFTDTNRSVCTGDSQTFPPTNGSGERLFAVYDFNGRGAPGYDVLITVTP